MKCVVAESHTFDLHNTCFFEGEAIYRELILFQIKNHKKYTVNKYKIVLNRDGDKRRVEGDGISRLAREQMT